MSSSSLVVYVVSDLHLSGDSNTPMCPPTTRARLARFIDRIAAERTLVQDVQLVIGGDIIDYLAESHPAGVRAFTTDPDELKRKTAKILEATSVVWDALQRFTASRCALTLLLGNHDLELSLPGARRALLEAVGPGRVEFIYDNQALTIGPVLVEHGNRYDPWNAVPHDTLRGFRSAASRGEAQNFTPLPGSQLVVDLVNPLKEQLSFVDLLKPEDAALLPFLALLSPHRFRDAIGYLKGQIRASRVGFTETRRPSASNYIAAPAGAEPAEPYLEAGIGDHEDDALIQLAEHLASGGDPAMASSANSFLDTWKARLAATFRDKLLAQLHRALRAFSDRHYRAFDLTQERDSYLVPATEAALHDFDVIVYGHTHLPKCVPLAGRRSPTGRTLQREATYLNSGTWADLMAIPEQILVGDAELLTRFADDLSRNDLGKWRRSIPTFARIELARDGGASWRVTDAHVALCKDDGSGAQLTTKILRDALEGRHGARPD